MWEWFLILFLLVLWWRLSFYLVPLLIFILVKRGVSRFAQGLESDQRGKV